MTLPVDGCCASLICFLVVRVVVGGVVVSVLLVVALALVRVCPGPPLLPLPGWRVELTR